MNVFEFPGAREENQKRCSLQDALDSIGFAEATVVIRYHDGRVERRSFTETQLQDRQQK